jgi:NAD(P)-dependent dehydrogenase (short-subunit alcohol dehydrogenase family)
VDKNAQYFITKSITIMASKPKVLVTGGNSGIGYALCKQLAIENNVHVFLGSRSEEKGEIAVKSIVESAPDAEVTLVVIDVSSDESVKAAALSLAEEKPFHAIVNNAGAGLAHGVSCDGIMNVNLYGAKRVTEAFLPLINPDGGRLVGTSSGLASGYASGKFNGGPIGRLPLEQRGPLTSFDCTWDQLQTIMTSERELGYGEEGQAAGMAAYGLSKAALTAYHMILARENPNLLVSTISPGFINTNMTSGFGASLQPEESTISLRKCILQDLGDCKGWYYGSDGLRSPLDRTRNPGEPEYQP